jgi:hypothetical protein
MTAPDDRALITSKLDKASALLEGWQKAVSGHRGRHELCAQDLLAQLRSRGFDTAAFPRLELTPVFLEPPVVRELTRCVRVLCSAFEQVHKLALTNLACLRQLEISPGIEELLRREPETRLSIEFARLDFIPTAGGPRFIEINTDSPRGAMLGSTLQRALLSHEFAQAAGVSRLQSSAASAELLADLFMAVWDERGSEHILRPNIALVDWRESDARPAQETLIAELRTRGLVAERVDPREFKYDRQRGALYCGNTRYDLIYRSITVPDIAVRRLLLSEFLDAVADGAVTLVNPLRARPAANAAELELLTTRSFDSLFSPGENEYKARLLPWTRRLGQRQTDFHGRDVDLLGTLAARPERFVIKPAHAQGDEITIGAKVTLQHWLSSIDEGVRQGHFAQEYVEPTPLHGSSKAQSLVLSAFAVRGEYAGCTGFASELSVMLPREAALLPILEIGGRSKTGPIAAGRPTRKRKPTNTQQN